jgi:hypothetical protein
MYTFAIKSKFLYGKIFHPISKKYRQRRGRELEGRKSISSPQLSFLLLPRKKPPRHVL